MPLLLFDLLIYSTFVYGVLIFLIIWGVLRLRPGSTTKKYFVSIIVAARNAETTIGACLQSLISQNYPVNNYEIIIVNDRSEDATGTIIKQFEQKHPQVTYLEIKELSNPLPPKKNALTQGVEKSKGELLFFTDADCSVPSNWLSEMVPYFGGDVGFVVGHAPLVPKRGLLEKLVSIEKLGMEYFNAGMIGLGSAFSCTGRNCAYRKEVFDQVGGYKKIAQSVSGDDDLYLQLVKKETSWKISFSKNPETFVTSTPPHTLPEFTRQRKRHISAAQYYSFPLLVLSGFIYTYYALFIIGCIGSFITQMYLHGLLIILLTKMCIEYVAIIHAGIVFNNRSGIIIFPLVSILFMMYVVIYSVWGLFGKVTWKQ